MTPNQGDSEPTPRVVAVWRIRDFHDDDLDAAIRSLKESRDTDAPPVVSLDEVVALARLRASGLGFCALQSHPDGAKAASAALVVKHRTY